MYHPHAPSFGSTAPVWYGPWYGPAPAAAVAPVPAPVHWPSHVSHYGMAPAYGTAAPQLIDLAYEGVDRNDPRWAGFRDLSRDAVVQAEEAERSRRMRLAHAPTHAGAVPRGLVDVGYEAADRSNPAFAPTRQIAVDAVHSAEEAERRRRMDEDARIPREAHDSLAYVRSLEEAERQRRIAESRPVEVHVPTTVVRIMEEEERRRRERPWVPAVAHQSSLEAVRAAEERERAVRAAEWARVPAVIHTPVQDVVAMEEAERQRRMMALPAGHMYRPAYPTTPYFSPAAAHGPFLYPGAPVVPQYWA